MTKSNNSIASLTNWFKFCYKNDSREEEDIERIAAREQKQFNFETLVRATKNFHLTHKLGEGGFGSVYRGKLNDGREIAVKRLSHISSQGMKEFKTEAKLLARVQHRNVVTLMGYCVHGMEKLLVYEYVANESLDKLLFKSRKQDALGWKQRYDIIFGVARGLVYLHEDAHSCIIHRDIKGSNILLDENWVPKIADFGMAHLFPEDQTHIKTRVAGTNGYMAPEYFMYGNLSTKADVFSFGVVVLELISGEKNSNFKRVYDSNLLEWAYKTYKQGKILDIVDPILASSAVPDEVAKYIQIGLLCVQFDPHLRPTMRRVVVLLSKKKQGILPEPTKPGLCSAGYSVAVRPLASFSSAGTSGEFNSHKLGSTTSSNTMTTATASTSGLKSPTLDHPRGKRPMLEH